MAELYIQITKELEFVKTLKILLENLLVMQIIIAGSYILSNNNIQSFSATILCFRNSKIIVKGNSSIIFKDCLVKWCADACLPYPGEIDAVMIDVNGIVWCSNQKAFNCLSDKCYNNCKDLKKKLGTVKNNKVVNITDNVVILSSVIELNSNDVLIIGHNNPIVICANDSGLKLHESNNLTIKGITWIRYGASEANYAKDIPVLEITYSSNACNYSEMFFPIFNGRGQVIKLTEVSRYVNINNCIFVKSNHYKGHGTSIAIENVMLSNHKFFNVFTVNNCDFSSNKDATVQITHNLNGTRVSHAYDTRVCRVCVVCVPRV